MSKKKINVDSMVNELEGASLYFSKPSHPLSKPVNDPGLNKSISQQPEKTRKQEPMSSEGKKVTQIATYKSTQISKGLSKHISKSISTDAVELLDFELRKVRKFRVNADIPGDWKEELDSLAFRLRVGKYELLTFVVGQFLGKVKRENQT